MDKGGAPNLGIQLASQELVVRQLAGLETVEEPPEGRDALSSRQILV